MSNTQLYLRQTADGGWREIDLEDTIALTYQMTDYSNPEAVKNAFSKTIEINGTARNTEFFRPILDLSSTVVNLDPCLKIDAMITVNGALFDSGYITLDEITRKNASFTLSVTYYSKAGQFLYNLQNKPDTEYSAESATADMTMADMYWKLPDTTGNRVLTQAEEKKSVTLFELNSGFIYNNWVSLNTYSPVWDNYADGKEYERGLSVIDEFYNNFAAVPMINGKYDTASASKSLWYCPNETQMNKFGVPFGYVSNSLGWIQAEMPRDMNEWEMNNIVALEQRVGVRMAKFLDAISYPENNGGFEVDFTGAKSDNYVKSVIDHSFIVMPKIEVPEDTNIFENDYSTINSDGIILSPTTGDYYVELEQPSNIFNWKTVDLQLDMYLKLDMAFTYKDPLNLWMTVTGANSGGTITNTGADFSFIMVTVDYYSQNVGHTEKNYCVTSCKEGSASDVTRCAAQFRTFLQARYDAGVATQYENRMRAALGNVVIFNPVYRAGETQNEYKSGKYYTKWQNEKPIRLIINGIDKSNTTVKLRCDTQRVSWYNIENNNPVYNVPIMKQAGAVMRYQSGSSTDLYDRGTVDLINSEMQCVYDKENDYESEFYNSENVQFEHVLVKKQTLFPSDVTPCDLFLQFIKTMNLRLYYDVNEDKIKVDTVRSFMANAKTVDLTDKIDMSSDIKIKHNFYDFNIMNYEFEQNDNYPNYLYKQNTGRVGNTSYMYRTRLVTGNTVNDENTDYLDDNKIQTCADYNLSSNYFSPDNTAPMLKGASCKISYMTAAAAGDYETEEAEKQWNLQKKYSDCTPKLCMMDKEESSIDGMIWCFYAGKVQLMNKLQVSNALPVMNQISDGLCFCRFQDHVWAEGAVSGYVRLNPNESGILGHNTGTIPLFSVYHYNKDGKMPVWTETVSDGQRKLVVTENASLPKWSLCWSTPQFTFSNMDVPKDNIYTMRFQDMDNDVYQHRSFTMTCSVRLNGNENVTEMMRDFYWYENRLFVLNKVEDYVAGQPGLYKCEFMTVNEAGAYNELRADTR